MPKIIVTNRYMRNLPGRSAGNLVKYMGTREGVEKLVSYIAEHPGVEKLGPHGLFSQTDDKINLNSVVEEVGNHKGMIWTHVISLRREDAERLGYNRASAWRDLVRRNVTELAEAQKIDVGNLQWYGAFHNTIQPTTRICICWCTRRTRSRARASKACEAPSAMTFFAMNSMETGLRDRLKKKSRLEMD